MKQFTNFKTVSVLTRGMAFGFPCQRYGNRTVPAGCMKKIVFFIALFGHLITWGQTEFSSKANGTKLTDSTLLQISQRLKDYEIVDFDHKSLDKHLKKSNKEAKIKIGKSISGTWNFEENELRATYIGKPKYDDNGNLLNGVNLAETYIVKSDNNTIANIRLFVSPDLISGFIHDGDSFIRIESLSYFLKSQNTEYAGKVIIYDDRNAIVNNEIKCGVVSKKISTTATSVPSGARTATNSCNRLLSIAVETDAEFNENIGSVMQEVDYILNINFGIKVSYYHKPWSSNQPGYPYTSAGLYPACPYIPDGNPGAGRVVESCIFSRFQNAGWIVNNMAGYDMYHFITGKLMFAPTSGNSGGYALGTPICGSQKPLSISTTEFNTIGQVARTMCHELGHNLAGNAYHDTNCNACPNNNIMCTFIPVSGGCRGQYFSTTSVAQIEANLAQSSSCLDAIPAPIINQVYFNGTPVGTNLNFVSIRAGQMSVNVSNFYPFLNPTVYFTPTVNTVNVYGYPSATILYYVPNNVSSYVMQISTWNPCGAASKNIPFLYGSGFKLYPNPATNVAFIEFDISSDDLKNELLLPQIVTLKTEKNEILKKNQPKQDFINKKLEDGKRLKWDISTLPNGIYFVEVVYTEKNTSTVRLLVQR